MKVYEFNNIITELSVSGDWGYMTPRAWLTDDKPKKNFLNSLFKVYKGYSFAKRDEINFKPIWGNKFINDVSDLLKEDEENDNLIKMMKLKSYIKWCISYKLFELFKNRSMGKKS